MQLDQQLLQHHQCEAITANLERPRNVAEISIVLHQCTDLTVPMISQHERHSGSTLHSTPGYQTVSFGMSSASCWSSFQPLPPGQAALQIGLCHNENPSSEVTWSCMNADNFCHGLTLLTVLGREGCAGAFDCKGHKHSICSSSSLL